MAATSGGRGRQAEGGQPLGPGRVQLLEHRHRAGVAARHHGQVDPLAPLVGADEQRPGRGRHRPGLPDPAGVVAPGDAGDPHPPHLVGDHVAVADHEPGDGDEQLGQPQPLEPRSSRHRGGGGEDRRGGDPEGALGDDVPGAPQPADGQRHPEDLDPLALADERQEHGEQQERQLDDQPPGQEGQRHPADRGHGGERQRRTGRRPRTPRGGWPRRRRRTARWRRACTGAGHGAAGSSRAGRARWAWPAPTGQGARVGSARPSPSEPHGPQEREQRQPDAEGDQHADEPGEAGAQPVVVDALDRVAGQRAVRRTGAAWRCGEALVHGDLVQPVRRAGREPADAARPARGRPAARRRRRGARLERAHGSARLPQPSRAGFGPRTSGAWRSAAP